MRKVNLAAAIKFLEGRAALAMEDFNKDYIHAFKWGSHEDAYRYHIQIRFLRDMIGKDRSAEAVQAEITKRIYRLVETSIHQNVLNTRCNQLELSALKDLAGTLHRYSE